MTLFQSVVELLRGGPNSGHRGHKGIPGHRGGSLPSSSGLSAPVLSSKYPDAFPNESGELREALIAECLNRGKASGVDPEKYLKIMSSLDGTGNRVVFLPSEDGVRGPGVLAANDGSEAYRWSNLQEVLDVGTADPGRTMDVTVCPFMRFNPPSAMSSYQNARGGPEWETFGRVILDKGELEKAGWVKDKSLAAEAAYRWMPKQSRRPDDFDAAWKDMQDSYRKAIRGYEVYDLPTGITIDDVRSKISAAIGRDIPVGDASHHRISGWYSQREVWDWSHEKGGWE